MSGGWTEAQRTAQFANNSYHQQRQGYKNGTIITPMLITFVQKWLKERLGVEAALCLERDGERNRVSLRFADDSYMYVAEVSCLNALRKKDPRVDPKQVLVLFEKRANG